MEYTIDINLPLRDDEVPALRKSVGWEARQQDYPLVFQRCNFWASARDEDGKLIAFGYICGMGLEHGYLEDVMVHPAHQGKGLGKMLVRALLEEARRSGLSIITVTYAPESTEFYLRCGFTACPGGLATHPFK